MKFDASTAWTDAMAMLRGQREILLTLTGFFILLPLLMVTTLRPFDATAQTFEQIFEQYQAWANDNLAWLLLVLVLAAIGRLTMLILLLAPERPTVAEALRASVTLLPLLLITDFLSFVPFALGMTLFVIPGLYIAGRLLMVEVALVAQRLRNPLAPLAASWRTSRGNGWRIALMLLILFIAAQLLQTAIGLTLGVVLTLIGGQETGNFALLLVSATANAALQLVILLVAVAGWRQLAVSR
jgi:hypothetical protein